MQFSGFIFLTATLWYITHRVSGYRRWKPTLSSVMRRDIDVTATAGIEIPDQKHFVNNRLIKPTKATSVKRKRKRNTKHWKSEVHQKTILKIHAHSKRTDIANRFLNNTFDSKRSLPLENPHPEDPTRPLTTASYYQQANIKQATAISKSEVDAVETSQESSKQNKTSAIRIGNQIFTENTQNNESSVSVKELAAEQSSNQTSDDNIRYEGVSVNANATENVSGEVNNSNVTNEAEKLVQNTAEDKNDNSKSDETDTADSDGEIDDVKPTDSPDDDEVPPTVETEPDDKEMEEGGSAYSNGKNENEDDDSDEEDTSPTDDPVAEAQATARPVRSRYSNKTSYEKTDEKGDNSEQTENKERDAKSKLITTDISDGPAENAEIDPEKDFLKLQKLEQDINNIAADIPNKRSRIIFTFLQRKPIIEIY